MTRNRHSENIFIVKFSTPLKWLLTVVATAIFCVPNFANPGSNNFFASLENECSDEPQSVQQMATQRAREIIDSFYIRRHKFDGFNGAVLIAKDGMPIYSAAFGYADFSKKDTLTQQSPFQLASCSKTFTGTAIMLLAEQGFLSLDDSVQKYFPEFPYSGITIKLLLSHRTGLPDYTVYPKEYFPKADYINNQTLLNYFIEKKPPLRTTPGKMFMYCNTNYAILASVIEQVTGMTYHKFMHDVIFSPLGMSNTFVYNPDDEDACCVMPTYDSRWRVWKNTIYDGVIGDKGIYASAEDMLKWDNALRSGFVLSEESLQEAYKPRSLDRYSFVKEKEKNYGYGWRMMKQPDKTYLIYHNGFWHGSNNVFARDLDDGYTVIVLGNKANHNNYFTQPVWEVLNQLKNFDSVAEAP